MMEKKIIFLKAALICIGLLVLALCIFFLPLIAKDAANSSLKMAYVLYGILTVMYISVIPFFAGLYQSYKLLNYIKSDQVFTNLSIKALDKIKKYAYIISIMYLSAMPLIYIVAEVDDAPGAILFGMIFVLAPLVTAVFADVLKNIWEKAIY
jgi:hypothetical protein